MMGGDEAMETYEICMGANLTCMNDLMNRMGEIEMIFLKGENFFFFFNQSLPHSLAIRTT